MSLERVFVLWRLTMSNLSVPFTSTSNTTLSYTEEQKTLLTKILAEHLYSGFFEDSFFEPVIRQIKDDLSKFEWFRCEGNLLPYLESIEVKGAYSFPLVQKVRFYVRICFSDNFSNWLFSFLPPKKPSFELFLSRYMSDKVICRKPTPEMLSGRFSIQSKKKRLLNWG